MTSHADDCNIPTYLKKTIFIYDVFILVSILLELPITSNFEQNLLVLNELSNEACPFQICDPKTGKPDNDNGPFHRDLQGLMRLTKKHEITIIKRDLYGSKIGMDRVGNVVGDHGLLYS